MATYSGSKEPVARKGHHRVSGSPARVDGDNKMWAQWKQQLTAYVQWVNSQLRKKPGAHLVEDLRHDVRDGVVLVDLLEVIAGERLLGIHVAPSTHSEMRDNVDKVLQFMTTNKIKMHHITTRDVVEGNLKAIMRLILALAAHYKPNSVRQSAPQTSVARQNLAGLAQGAAAALTEARRNANRAGSHRYRRRRPKASPDPSDSDQSQEQSTPLSHHTPNSRQAPPSNLMTSSGHQYHQHHTPHSQQRKSSSMHTINSRSSHHRTEGEGRGELEGASASSSPVSSGQGSPRTSLYLSEPSSSMDAIMTDPNHRGHVMLTSCESDNNMADSGYQEVCNQLKDTHQMLFHLHELLLNGEMTDDSGQSTAGEDLENSSPKETISLLKARLLHAEEICETLRAEVTKVKNECLHLQGTNSGLQQRLSAQDAELSQTKSELMKLELEKDKMAGDMEALRSQLAEREQTLSDVKTTFLKQLEDKDNVSSDLRRELLKRDQALLTLRNQTALNGDLRSAVDQVVPDLVSDDHAGTHYTPVAGNMSQNQRPTVGRDGPRGITKTRVRGSPRGSPVRRGGQTVPRQQVSPRASTGFYTPPSQQTALNSLNKGSPSKQGRSQIPIPHGVRTKSPSPTQCDTQTQVVYYLEDSDKPHTCIIRKKLGEIRLRDVKTATQDSHLLHYFFKALDPEYGTVKEELCNDSDLVPGWEGKIVAWIEEDKGTVC